MADDFDTSELQDDWRERMRGACRLFGMPPLSKKGYLKFERRAAQLFEEAFERGT